MTYSDLVMSHDPSVYISMNRPPVVGQVLQGSLGVTIQQVDPRVVGEEVGWDYNAGRVVTEPFPMSRTNVSIFFWYKATGTEKLGFFIYKDAATFDTRHYIGTYLGGTNLYVDASTSRNLIRDGKWHFFGVTRGTGYWLLYSDWEAWGTLTASKTTPADGFLYLGGVNEGSTASMAGYGVVQRQLSGSEMLALYQAGPPLPEKMELKVLESGLEVPVEIEGESLYAFGNDSPIATAADLYFNENEVWEPITTTLSRTNTLPTTYSVWAKWNSAPTGPTGIFSHQPGTTFATNNNNLYVQATGVLYFNSSTGGTTVNISDHFTDGQWHHYAATITGNTHLLYVDGVLRETKTLSKSSVALNTVRFGLMVSGSTQYGPLPGTLDDCAVVSSVLSDQDIADIYNAGRYVFEGFKSNPLTVEGVYREAIAGNPAHSLVTGADLYYSDYSNEPGFEAATPVETPITRTTNSGASYSMWVQFPDTVSSVQGLLNHQNGTSETGANSVYLLSTGEIRATNVTGVNISGYQDGQFHHLCYVHDAGASTFRLYMDGQQVYTSAHADATLNTLRFGTLASGSSTYPFQGKMDDLMMTSEVLTAQQVMDIYNAGRSTVTPARVEPI